MFFSYFIKNNRELSIYINFSIVMYCFYMKSYCLKYCISFLEVRGWRCS